MHRNRAGKGEEEKNKHKDTNLRMMETGESCEEIEISLRMDDVPYLLHCRDHYHFFSSPVPWIGYAGKI
ncbi:Envelopment polyprotein [Dirofilaria immitis]